MASPGILDMFHFWHRHGKRENISVAAGDAGYPQGENLKKFFERG